MIELLESLPTHLAVLLAVVAYLVNLSVETAKKIVASRNGGTPEQKLTRAIESLERSLAPLPKMADELEDLHRWHDVTDPTDPTSKIWYVPGTMKEKIDCILHRTDRTERLVEGLSRSEK